MHGAQPRAFTTERSRFPAADTTIIVAAFALSTVAVATIPPADDDPETENPWVVLQTALTTLESGDLGSRREIANDDDSVFEPLGEDHDDAQAAARPEVIESLRSLLRIEPDDWTVSRLLEELEVYSNPLFQPLYLDAMTHPSVNVRWRAYQHFAEETDPDVVPELEAAWHDRMPSWVRADLMKALATQESKRYLREFLSLAGGEDRTLSEAAIDALGDLGDDSAIARLNRIARSGGLGDRIAAVRALASWPDSAEAEEAVIEASRTEEDSVRNAAFATMPTFKSDAVRVRLLELSRGSDGDEVRARALIALGGVQGPGVVPALLDALQETTSDESEIRRAAAFQSLWRVDDPAAIPQLREIAGLEEDPESKELAELIAHLARDRSGKEPAPDFTITARLHQVLGPEYPDFRTVSPPDGWNSVRCWRSPGIAGEPSEYERMPSGLRAYVTDHYEDAGESWVEVRGWVTECWLRSDMLEAGHAGQDSVLEEKPKGIRLEFDLPATEAGSAAVQELVDGGFLEIFDPAVDVVGATLDASEPKEKTVDALADCYGHGSEILDRQIVVMVAALAKELPDDAALASLSRRIARSR